MTLATDRARARPDAQALEATGLLRLIEGGSSSTAAERILRGEPHFRQFLEALGVAVYTTDRRGRITFYNEAAAQLWGRRPEPGEEWCGSWRLFAIDGQPLAHDECPMAIALREQRAVRGHEAIAERPDGTRVWFTPYPTPLLDEQGRMVGAVNVLIDVTERRRAEEALGAAAQELRVSNAVKDEFLGLVSHELRTPVTTIFGNARLLRDRATRLKGNDRDSMIADIAEDSERLLGIIENLLVLTRLEISSDIEAEPQVLAHVVRKQVDAYRARHPERRLSLRREPRHIIVESDRGYLEMVLENMLSNADKYSPPESTIEVAVRTRATEAHVLVLDRGIGIGDEEEEQVFTAFYRAPQVRNQGNGVGIGLAVCKRVVESQGGRIWARARAGGGSEVGFALPLAPAPKEIAG